MDQRFRKNILQLYKILHVRVTRVHEGEYPQSDQFKDITNDTLYS